MTKTDLKSDINLCVDTTINAEYWKTHINAKSISQDYIKDVCQAVYKGFENIPAEVSVVLSDDAFVRSLNNKYRQQDKPTNVLSFPASDPYGKNHTIESLGDIIIAFETVKTEAQEQEKTFHNHCTHLIIHGMLHLLGFDHITKEEAEEMEQLEIEILHEMGIENPYLNTDIL